MKGIKLPTSTVEMSIILLIDTSGSMGSNNKIGNAKSAAIQTVSRASAMTEIALLAYDGGCGGGWRVEQGFTGDVSALTQKISGLRPGGGTPTAPAIGFAVDYMKNNGKGKQQQILLLTDGQNDCGSMRTAGDAIRQSQIKVDAIGFGVPTGSQAQTDLGLIVANGGRAYNAANGKELIKAFNRAFLLDTIKPMPGSLPSARKDRPCGRISTAPRRS